jgi:hypothetical protein
VAGVDTRELPLTAIAGGAAVLASVTLWQLGIEFERAWIRSYDSPMLGESRGRALEDSLRHAPVPRASAAAVERRRWVADPGARRMTHTPRRGHSHG